MLGGRSLDLVRREALQPANYRALARSARVYVRPREALGRYLLGRGGYPHRCAVRTPLGVVAPELHHPHDMFTMNEIFCREDYRAGPADRVVVDIGSNIGISALYFLTRSPAVRCRLYEPVPRNAARLRANLAAFDGRWELTEAAVAETAGTVRFGVEGTGRYGGIGVATGEEIEVDCLDVNDVLAAALKAEGRVDVLKLDTEGAELRTLAAIAPEHVARIGLVYLEAEVAPPAPPGFDLRMRSQTVRLANRAAQRA
jgi:FkbM family methyltransferase